MSAPWVGGEHVGTMMSAGFSFQRDRSPGWSRYGVAGWWHVLGPYWLRNTTSISLPGSPASLPSSALGFPSLFHSASHRSSSTGMGRKTSSAFETNMRVEGIVRTRHPQPCPCECYCYPRLLAFERKWPLRLWLTHGSSSLRHLGANLLTRCELGQVTSVSLDWLIFKMSRIVGKVKWVDAFSRGPGA